MATRVRERFKKASGAYTQRGTLPAGYEAERTVEYQYFSDQHPKLRDKETRRFPLTPMYNRRYRWHWTPFNYRASTQGPGQNIWLNGSLSMSSSAISYPPGRRKSNDFYFNELLVRTSPYRPQVSLPVFAKELVDVTSLFKWSLERSLRSAGRNHLNYKFGWVPFLADIKKFTTILREMETRMREFDSLYRAGGLRRTVKLDSFQNEYRATNELLMSSPFSVYGNKHYIARWQLKGGVRWFPTNMSLHSDTLPSIEPLTRTVSVLKTLLDLDHEVAHWDTYWEMIPFSWLVDYFVDVGAFLASSHGRLYVEPQDIWLQEQCDYRNYAVGTRGSKGLSLGDTTCKGTVKERFVKPNGWQLGSIPLQGFLSEEKMLTLLALAASRGLWNRY